MKGNEMTLADALNDIRTKIEKFGDALDNEETTKDVLIRPMIQALGYDTSDPTEVRAEYPVKLANGGSGRADYVIFRNGQPVIVIECKAARVAVDETVSDQMREYAIALGAAVGVATNGFAYACHADLESVGTIDADPFCFAVIQTLTEGDEDALSLLSKGKFAADSFRESANAHKRELESRWRAEVFLRGAPAQDELARIAEMSEDSEREAELSQLLHRIGERMRLEVDAINRHGRHMDAEDGVVTTSDEWDAYFIVKGMLHGVIDPDRVKYRDRKTYFSVLIDDNNRKPICRFHFNGRQKHLGTFDADKQETRHLIEEVDDLLKFARTIRSTARRYAES